MNEVTRAVGRAGRWLALGRAGRALVVIASVAGAALTLLLLSQRVFAFPIDWPVVATGVGAAVVVACAAWAWRTRPRAIDVARAVDARAGLRETLSTAMFVRAGTDAWSRATQEEAERVARGLVVRREFPVRAPRLWWGPLAAGVAFALVWALVPTWDVLGAGARTAAKESDRVEAQTVAAEVAADREKLDSMLAGVEGAEQGGAPMDEPVAGPASAEQIRRAAVKRLTDVTDRLADVRSGEKGIKLDAMREAMRDLRRPGPGPLDDAAKALQRGDFAGAKSSLDQLQEQAAQGNMTEEQQRRLKEQAKDLAGQLARLAQQKEAVERALEEKGMDKGLASDLEGLKKALEKNDALTDEQKKQLEDMAEGVAGANQQCENLAQAMSKMAEGGAGAMGEAGEQLSQMEMLQQQMDGADAARQEALAQLDKMSQGMGGSMDLLSKYDRSGRGKKQGEWSDKQGSGRAGEGEQMGGGRGQGSGAEGNLEESAHKTEKSKASSPNREGPIIGTMLVNGQQVRGESRAAFGEAVTAAGASAAEAIEANRVPKEFEGAVKRYFGRLEAKTKATAMPAPASPAPPPPPAPEGAKPAGSGS